MRAHQSLPLAVWPLTAVACLVFGGLTLLLGMDGGADLRGHQYYSGWVLLHDLTGRDLGVSGPAGYLNPAASAVYVLLSELLPARAVGFMLGMMHGFTVPLLFAICWRMLDVRNPNRRMLAAGALSIAGALGTSGLSLLGTAALDNIVALGILAAVLSVVGNWEDLSDDAPPTAAMIVALAGVPAGVALGLKPSMAIVCVGLVLAFLFANLPVMRRLWLAAWFLAGLTAGTALSGGLWMAHLWKMYGNPFFPYLNHLFLSPWAAPESYLDRTFLPASLIDALTLPFRFPFDPTLVSETTFRDYRTLAIIILVPIAGLVTALRRDRDPGIVTLPGPSSFLMAATFIALIVWAIASGRHRHLAAFEMLAPIVIVAAIGALPLPRAGRRGFAAAVVAFVTVTAFPAGSERADWPDRSAPAVVPAIETPASTLVLLNGSEKLSYLIPSFPKETRFIHLDPWLPADASALRKAAQDLIIAHQGNFATLHAASEQDAATRRLAESGLDLDGQSCRAVISPISSDSYSLCAAHRPMPVAPAEEAPQPAAPEGQPKGDASKGSAGSRAPR